MAKVYPSHEDRRRAEQRDVYHDRTIVPMADASKPKTAKLGLRKPRCKECNQAWLIEQFSNVISQCGPVGSLLSSMSHTRQLGDGKPLAKQTEHGTQPASGVRGI